MPLSLLNALHGHKLLIYGHGVNVRGLLHVENLCRGIELILRKGRVRETDNVGGGSNCPTST